MIVRNNISRTPQTPTPETLIAPPAGKKKEKTEFKFDNAQNLVLGLASGLGQNNWGKTPELNSINNAENAEELFSTNAKTNEERTYNFADNNKANTVTLGLTGANLIEDTNTIIKLGKGDSLKASALLAVSGLTRNDDGTVTLVLQEVLKNPNYNPKASNKGSQWEEATHTKTIIMPESELKSITAGLSAKQKEAIQKFQDQIETDETNEFIEETIDDVFGNDEGDFDPLNELDEDESQPPQETPGRILTASAVGTGRLW